MEAKSVDLLPEGEGWQFEPKWDGFRCLVFKTHGEVELVSKSGKPLARYFPEVAAAIAALPEESLALDGELLIPVGPSLSFEALQARLHPAESRIRKLSAETPARLMLFDWLAEPALPLAERRNKLEAFYARHRSETLRLSPATTDPGSLLLGLYDDAGLLHHAGFTSGLPAVDKPALTKQLEALIEAPGFTGDAPGGPSRWSTGRSAEWQPLRHELVAEVRYDHVSGRRFRHGTGFLRWRRRKHAARLAACTSRTIPPPCPPRRSASTSSSRSISASAR